MNDERARIRFICNDGSRLVNLKQKKRILVLDYIVVNDSIVTEKCLPEVTKKNIRENRHPMMQRLSEERRNAMGYYAKENTSYKMYNKITILTSTT